MLIIPLECFYLNNASAFSKHDLLLSYDFRIITKGQAIKYRDFKNNNFASLKAEFVTIPWNQIFLLPTVDEQINILQRNIQCSNKN